MNMIEWAKQLPQSKKSMPILAYPSAKTMGVNAKTLISNSDLQSEGIYRIAQHTNAAAAFCIMDLSVEAEAFGATIEKPTEQAPFVTAPLVRSMEEALMLNVPEIGAGRTKLYIQSAIKAKRRIFDRPVFATMIGPFSLAGILMGCDVALQNCQKNAEYLHVLLRKATDFLLTYAKSYKEAGLNGILLAEPLAGGLSAENEKQFSLPYVKELIAALQDESFLFIYHNCGSNVLSMVESFSQNGAAIYHFGDAVPMREMLDKMPKNKPVCGNISPVTEFLLGTPESVYNSTCALIEECRSHPNFVLSSGCDIPSTAPWANIDAFFKAVSLL